MTIAPIVRSVEVAAPPARAFDLFANHMEAWWPKGRTIGKSPHVTIVAEPHPGGAWFERDAEGNATHWGNVLAWEPPARLLLAWRINSQWTYDPDLLTEVELTFEALATGGTKVTLEHRHLERIGVDAARHAELLGGGWPGYLALFVQYADAHA